MPCAPRVGGLLGRQLNVGELNYDAEIATTEADERSRGQLDRRLEGTHRSHNVHLAPQLHIIRSAIAQFDDSPQQTALSFVAKLSNVSTEWGLLRSAMEAVGARGISGQLPHMRDTRNTSKCRAGMGVHGSAQTFPSASLRILCAYLLEDFVCLDFPFPDACLEKRHV